MRNNLQPRATACTALLVLAAACGSTDNPTPEQAITPPAAPIQGEWVRVPLGAAADTVLWHNVLSVATTSTGAILVLGDFGSDPAKRLMAHVLTPGVDSLVSFGRAGEGPGELSGFSIALGDGDGFAIVNLGRQVVQRVDALGRLLDEQRMELLTDVPLAVSSAGVDVQSLRTGMAEDAPVVFRVASENARHTILTQRDLTPPDGNAVASPRRPALLPYATTRDGKRIAYLLPGGYSIAQRDVGGERVEISTRSLEAPARLPEEVAQLRHSLEADLATSGGNGPRASALRSRLDTLERERLPHLAWPGLHYDDRDRLWAVGRTADSTFVDAFVEGAFVNRQVLPCRTAGKRASLVGEWLALICDRPDRDDAPFEVQLYQYLPLDR